MERSHGKMGIISDALKQAELAMEKLKLEKKSILSDGHYCSVECSKCGFVNAITEKQRSESMYIVCKRCHWASY